MGLADTDDAISHRMSPGFIHFELLKVKGVDDLQALDFIRGKSSQGSPLLLKVGANVSEVALDEAQLLTDGFADLFAAGLFGLGDGEKLATGFLTVGPRLFTLANERGMELVEVGFGFLAGFAEKFQWDR